MADYTNIKLMIPITSTIDKCFIDNDCNVSEDLNYIVFDSLNEAQNALNVMKSKLYRYIGKMYRSGRNMGGFNTFPCMDFKKSWTDQEIYDYFGLTQEEIDYIEKTIK